MIKKVNLSLFIITFLLINRASIIEQNAHITTPDRVDAVNILPNIPVHIGYTYLSNVNGCLFK